MQRDQDHQSTIKSQFKAPSARMIMMYVVSLPDHLICHARGLSQVLRRMPLPDVTSYFLPGIWDWHCIIQCLGFGHRVGIDICLLKMLGVKSF